MELARINPQVGKAFAIIKRLSGDARTRRIAELEEKARRDERMRINSGRLDGLEQGLEQGRLEGEQKGRLEGLRQGIEQRTDDILKLIDEGLTAEQIRERLSGR